jgi:hypothetical protein
MATRDTTMVNNIAGPKTSSKHEQVNIMAKCQCPQKSKTAFPQRFY